MSAGAVTPRMPRGEYDQIRRVNWSTLKHLAVSPLHYLHELEKQGEGETTDAMKLGSAVHVAVLEPELFRATYVIWDGGRRQGKAWDAFRADNADREILTLSELESVVAMQHAVREHPIAGPYVRGGESEVTITWEHRIPAAGDWPEVVTPCKGRLDYLRPDAIVDLKTARDGSIDGFGRACWNLRYHTQLAFYRDGLAAVTGRKLPVKMVVVESKAPYAVTVFDVPEHVLEIGREEYVALLSRLDWCRSRNEWPGYADGEVELLLPRWAVGGSDASEDLDGLGLVIGEE